MTKPREFWIYSPNLEDDESDHCDDFVFSSKPTTSPFNKMEFFHVREISKDEIRVSRQMWDELKAQVSSLHTSTLEGFGDNNCDGCVLSKVIERIEQESK